MQQHGRREDTIVTILTDGAAGLRAVQRVVAPEAEPVLDWFPIALRFENLKQVAKGMNSLTDAALRQYALTQIERGKWRFWHGRPERGLIGLVGLRQWAHARCFEHIPAMVKLGTALLDVIRYLEANADSLPNYGQRYRSPRRVSTGFAESAVNEIIAKRMNKKQQMRWKRHTVQQFLEVGIQVLNNTLEDAFRHWHRGFRPEEKPSPFATAA